MIAIIDYDCGNLRSVENALGRIGCEYILTADPSVICAADKVILPGVGNASEAMSKIEERGLTPIIRSLRRPVLGICVGLQIMCRDSEESSNGLLKCMDIFDAHVKRFPDDPMAKVPHIGWNNIGNTRVSKCRLFDGLNDKYLYFVHSYYASLCQDTAATCVHGGVVFSAVLKYENFYGTQFHPEKSGPAGERILRNFLEL